MKIMITSQKIRQGRADHLASSRWRKPSTIGNQRGSVCTSWRRDPFADGTNDIERHQDSKGAVRDPFRRVPHRISNTRAPVKFVPMLSGASLAAHLDLDYGALEVIHLGANAHSETDSLEV